MINTQFTSNEKYKVALFLGLTFLFSWLVWGAMIAFNPSDELMLPLLFLGAFGPTLAAAVLVQLYGVTGQKSNFWRRVIHPGLINWKWYAFIFLVYPAILVVGYNVYGLLGGTAPTAASFFEGIESFQDFVFLMFIMLLGGPLAEELGWRGYLQDPYTTKWGALKASFAIGLIWIVWHLPLFFIEGTSQQAKGFGIQFWSWSVQLIFNSILFTWVYYKTKRSILAAVLLHLMANIAYPPNLDNWGEGIFTAVRILAALLIVMYGFRNLGESGHGDMDEAVNEDKTFVTTS